MPGRLRDPGPSVKDARLDEALREDGNSKEKSARIDEWTVSDLRRKAAEVGITGRSRMRKSELISALREH
ncbi:MAG: DUF7218 family protein [Cellulomonas sp.]